MTLMLNLAKIYALSDKLPPDLRDHQGAAIISSWNEALAAIPTDWLDRAFTYAIQYHRGAFTVTFGEVLDAWDSLLSERQHAATTPANTDHLLPGGAATPCKACHGAGRVVNRAQPVGHRADEPCPRCQGTGRQPGFAAEPPTYYVGNLLIVFKTFCDEHRDPLLLPTRLTYALAAVAAGARAGNFRDLLESTGQPTLYAALTDLGIAVEPPPAPKAGTVGAWAKVGDAL
jgi:hypothetical protein